MPWEKVEGYFSGSMWNISGGPPPNVDRPVDPGYGIDEGTGRPPSGSRPPHISHQPIKPPGFKIIPRPDNSLPPEGGPSWPGDWVPVDPGFGQPPIFGWRPVDPGFGVGEGGNLPGHWVPVDPGYGLPEGGGDCSCDKPPLWLWIAEIGPDFGTLPAPPPQVAKPKK